MSKRLSLVLSLLAAAAILLMLNFTTPSEVGPFGVLVFFALVYVVMFGIAQCVVRVFAWILDRKVGLKEQLYGALIAMGPIMILLVKSLGSLSILSVGVVVVLILLACFLVNKQL